MLTEEREGWVTFHKNNKLYKTYDIGLLGNVPQNTSLLKLDISRTPNPFSTF